MRHHLGYSSTTALLTECLRYCMFHVPVFLQFFTKTCEGCFSSWLPFKSNLPFFFFFFDCLDTSESPLFKLGWPFYLLHLVFKMWEWAESLHSQGQGAWEISAAARQLWASTHFLFSGLDQKHPTGVRGSNPNQAVPQHLQEAPDCLYLAPERCSSCWVPAGILNADVFFSHRGWK